MATVRKIATKPKKKKISIPRRAKTGIAAAPVDKGFMDFKHYFHAEIERKDFMKVMKDYTKKNASKSDCKAILACPDHVFYIRSHVAACMQWINLGLKFEPRKVMRNILQDDGSVVLREVAYSYDGYVAIDRFFKEATILGTAILKTRESETEEKSNIVILNPTQRYQAKLNETILTDLDELEEEWISGEEPEFDLYNRFRFHLLTGKAAEPVRRLLEGWLLDFTDAYHKRCDQAVEGYSHVKRSVMRRRIKHVELMLEDCVKLKAASAATRKVSKPRVKSADKQVAKMKYKKDDAENKLVSINPISIVGAMRLYVFNVKTREITEYVSGRTDGFSMKGTTLQGFEVDNSRKIRLRKPAEFLTVVQSKTPKQIDNAWDKLTTKESKPNGRINDDCVLVKVSDK